MSLLDDVMTMTLVAKRKYPPVVADQLKDQSSSENIEASLNI